MGLNISKGNMYEFVTHTWNIIKGECFHDCTYCYMKRWDFTVETQWLKQLLPERYKCEPRENGVYCYDPTGEGINDDHMAHEPYNPETDNHFALIVKAIKQKFGDRLMEINGIEPQYWTKFKVYLRPE